MILSIGFTIISAVGIAVGELCEPKTSRWKRWKKAGIIVAILVTAIHALRQQVEAKRTEQQLSEQLRQMSSQLDSLSRTRELTPQAVAALVEKFASASISNVIVTVTSDDAETRRLVNQFYTICALANKHAIRKAPSASFAGHIGVTVHAEDVSIFEQEPLKGAIKLIFSEIKQEPRIYPAGTRRIKKDEIEIRVGPRPFAEQRHTPE